MEFDFPRWIRCGLDLSAIPIHNCPWFLNTTHPGKNLGIQPSTSSTKIHTASSVYQSRHRIGQVGSGGVSGSSIKIQVVVDTCWIPFGSHWNVASSILRPERCGGGDLGKLYWPSVHSLLQAKTWRTLLFIVFTLDRRPRPWSVCVCYVV